MKLVCFWYSTWSNINLLNASKIIFFITGDSVRKMETKIEELAQEQAKRAEYREKERVEVNQLNEEI